MPAKPFDPNPCSPATVDYANRPFAVVVRAFIEEGDEPGLRRFLQLHWNLSALTRLIHADDVDSARTAAYCLGVLGGEAAVLPLLGALSHDDSGVAASAEDALWRIWFNAAGASARRRLLDAVTLMAEERYSSAIATLDGLVEQHTRFAEAFHHRALARHLMGDQTGAARDFGRAIELNPCHFAAHAGMGRCHADAGRYPEALACLRRALRIHPRQDCVRQTVRMILEAADGSARCAPAIDDAD